MRQQRQERLTRQEAESAPMLEEVRERSGRSAQRITVDEVFSDGRCRVAVAELKPGSATRDVLDWRSWGRERTMCLSRAQLEVLLGSQHAKTAGEGSVYRIKAKRAKSIYEQVRKQAKLKTERLLAREGKAGPEIGRTR